MDAPQGLTLNESALLHLPEDERPLYIFEWLLYLERNLPTASKAAIKDNQQKIVTQLTDIMKESLGLPSCHVLARCMATLFSIGDTFLLFDTVNVCNDIIKVKDDSPSYLPMKLAAICCLGEMYERLGRMMGRSYEDTLQTLLRSLKNAESQSRLEIIITLKKVCVGMGTATPQAIRDVLRVCKQLIISERVSNVRVAIAHTLTALISLMKLTQPDVDTIAAICIRAFDSSCYAVRLSIAELLGTLIAASQTREVINVKNNKNRAGLTNQMQYSRKDMKSVTSLDEALNMLMGGFLRGGSSFLKGDIIKSGSGVNREVRVGVTHAYVIFVQKMGSIWLEKNLSTFISHILDLVANPKAASSHVDAVYSRKCIGYIFRNTIGCMLGEKAQSSACKEIILTISKHMTSIDFNPENAKDCNQETLFNQHLLVCALNEVSELSLSLGSLLQALVAETSLNMLDAISMVLIHPSASVRLAGALCVRSVCTSLPQYTLMLLDRYTSHIECNKVSPEGIAGYGAAISAILGSVQLSEVGIPHARGKLAFNIAEQLLRSAGQGSKFTASKTNSGWLIIGAICTMGQAVVKGLLPRMLLLWRSCFPRTTKELESENARGDAFTWQMTLENRAGALSAVHSLLENCPQLAKGNDTLIKIQQIIDSALAVLTNISVSLKGCGDEVKAAGALLRLQAYNVSRLLTPTPSPALLRLLAADLTTDSLHTVLLKSVGHPSDIVFLGAAVSVYETDHADIEEQISSGVSNWGSAALAAEHGPSCVYTKQTQMLAPLGVAVLDAAVLLYAAIFPRTAHKHRLQMLEHFYECIKMAKGVRQEILQVNILTAVLLGLKGLDDCKSTLGPENIRAVTENLVMSALSSSNPWAWCGAAQCFGRGSYLEACGGANALCTKLVALLPAVGAIAALGALQRVAGPAPRAAASLCSSHSAPALLALAAAGGGPQWRALCARALTAARTALWMDRCAAQSAARLVCSLITSLGPELRDHPALCARLLLCVQAADEMEAHTEAARCLQRLQLFASHPMLSTHFVSVLQRDMWSEECGVRRATLATLHQISQRQALQLCQLASPQHLLYKGVSISANNLPSALFALLDIESDRTVLAHARDTIICILLTVVNNTDYSAVDGNQATTLKEWINLCKKVISVRQDDNIREQDTETEEDDDQEEFHAHGEISTHRHLPPRWTTRVFAMECIQKIMLTCEASGDEAHFDLIKAKMKHSDGMPEGSYLSYHVGELVRTSFVCATGEAVALRMAGLRSLQLVVKLFCRAPEPDFPGHLLLEHYQAQVSAALRPAFGGGTGAECGPAVTAAACDVCSVWIAAGVARDLRDLKRVHQLLVSSLHKLNNKTENAQIYSESMSTLEKLSILKAWAEIYIVAMISNGNAPGSYVKQLELSPINNQNELMKWRYSLTQIKSKNNERKLEENEEMKIKCESLLQLVEPELSGLSENWFAALKDHALLSLPNELITPKAGTFFTSWCTEAVKPHYNKVWPIFALAAALRTTETAELTDNKSLQEKDQIKENFADPLDEKFHLIFGVCMEALCAQRDISLDDTITILLAFMALLNKPENRARLLKDKMLAIELCNILHRIGLTQENIEPLLLAADILSVIILSAREQLDAKIDAKIKELAPNEVSSGREIPNSVLDVVQTLGEGGPTGDLPPGKSLVFTCLEVAYSLLVRRIPTLKPKKEDRTVGVIGVKKGLGIHGDTMLIKCLNCMSQLTMLTSPQGGLSILPTLLYVSTEIICCSDVNESGVILLTACCTLNKLYKLDDNVYTQYVHLMHSTLDKVITICKNLNEGKKNLNEGILAQSLALLLPYAPKELRQTAVGLLKNCLFNADSESFIKWCAHNDVESVGVVGGVLVRRVAAGLRAESQLDVTAACTALEKLQPLLQKATQQQRIQMLLLLVPIVMSFLRTASQLVKLPVHLKTLHEFGLQWLTDVGQCHRSEFKIVMQQSAELRNKLENAVKCSRQAAIIQNNLNRNQPTHQRNDKPSIQLKTDFSNFM